MKTFATLLMIFGAGNYVRGMFMKADPPVVLGFLLLFLLGYGLMKHSVKTVEATRRGRESKEG